MKAWQREEVWEELGPLGKCRLERFPGFLVVAARPSGGKYVSVALGMQGSGRNACC